MKLKTQTEELSTKDLVAAERNFLHKLASPIMVSRGLLVTVLEDSSLTLSEGARERLNNSGDAMALIQELLVDRRKALDILLGEKT